MKVKIVEEPIDIKELGKIGEEGFGDMVKGVVGSRHRVIVRGV